MIKNIRRKLANKISPEKSTEYGIVKLNWATAQSENRRILAGAHKKFEEVHGRPARDDAEAWKWDREQTNALLKEMGLEPSNPCTEYKHSYFYTEQELEIRGL